VAVSDLPDVLGVPGEPPAPGAVASEVLSCPRCGAKDATSRFYGPCEQCREILGATMRLVPRDVKVEAYAPKLNVVPNHVATKE
jgi:hypothetical protein